VDANSSDPRLLARHGQNERSIALGRKSWLFAGSERGADRAALMYASCRSALAQTLLGADPQTRRQELRSILTLNQLVRDR